jgi:hypothetical protein
MPRPRSKNPPAYSQHKASGRAVTRIEGRDHYLGPYGSPESHAAYERLISEWRAEQLDLQRTQLLTNENAGGWSAHKNLTVAPTSSAVIGDSRKRITSKTASTRTSLAT